MTSKMRSFGMSADTRTGSTGASGKAVRTVEQMVRLGAVISETANSRPRGQVLPVTDQPSPSRSIFKVQPRGQPIQVSSFMPLPPRS